MRGSRPEGPPPPTTRRSPSWRATGRDRVAAAPQYVPIAAADRHLGGIEVLEQGLGVTPAGPERVSDLGEGGPAVALADLDHRGYQSIERDGVEVLVGPDAHRQAGRLELAPRPARRGLVEAGSLFERAVGTRSFALVPEQRGEPQRGLARPRSRRPGGSGGRRGGGSGRGRGSATAVPGRGGVEHLAAADGVRRGDLAQHEQVAPIGQQWGLEAELTSGAVAGGELLALERHDAGGRLACAVMDVEAGAPPPRPRAPADAPP